MKLPETSSGRGNRDADRLAECDDVPARLGEDVPEEAGEVPADRVCRGTHVDADLVGKCLARGVGADHVADDQVARTAYRHAVRGVVADDVADA